MLKSVFIYHYAYYLFIFASKFLFYFKNYIMDDLVIIEIWYKAFSPASAAYCNYYQIPRKFCKPLYLRLIASCFSSLFVVCDSVYGCRQFEPLFKIIPWSLNSII